MSIGTWFGFAGDFLTFLGGLVLAVDALLEERKLNKIKDWAETVQSPALARVVITRKGVQLRNEQDVELSFLRQSYKRAVCGTLILTLGFICLFVARVLETRTAPHSGEKIVLDSYRPIVG
jgi:hypothetical protein